MDEAGNARFQFAVDLLELKRFSDARAYADMALANFRRVGNHAAAKIGPTERLIVTIAAAEDQYGKPA